MVVGGDGAMRHAASDGVVAVGRHVLDAGVAGAPFGVEGANELEFGG